MSDKSLTLKWGNVKGWRGLNDKDVELLQAWSDAGQKSASAMMNRNNDEERKALVAFLEQFDGEIWNDWDGVAMTSEEAVKYVSEYGK